MPFGFGRGRKNAGGGKGLRGGRRFWNRSGEYPVNCICSSCGMIVPHKLGFPCFQTKCSRCGSPMTRQFFVD
ncbi:MAG: hypothetical protein P9M06_03315 [Candidatus Saelkia tenebricola]|nr:hypothetical protein [Candidatus Saelkia tenebricola]